MTLSELLKEARKVERDVREYCIDNGIAIPRHYIKKWRLIDTPTGPRLVAYIAEVKKEKSSIASPTQPGRSEYFSSGGKEMNIFEYLKFCSEVVPGLAEMSHSETDTEKKKQMLQNALQAYKFIYGRLMPPPT